VLDLVDKFRNRHFTRILFSMLEYEPPFSSNLFLKDLFHYFSPSTSRSPKLYTQLRFLTEVILCRIRPLLRGDSVNDGRCYGAPVAYACAVTLHYNIIGYAVGVFCGSSPRLYDSTNSVLALHVGGVSNLRE
jgi:hypothetical protein